MLASIQQLLYAIVDYAGLFPPAKLGMQSAMTNYLQYQRSDCRWLLGHFVLPASRFSEFFALLSMFPLSRWSLSVILSQAWESELQQMQTIDHPAITLAAIEFPPLSLTEIPQIWTHLPTGGDRFFEIPLNTDLTSYCAILQSIQAAAKIRTGGVTVEAFPSVPQLAEGILSLAQAQIPFKATAGLHHPLPAAYQLTDAPDSPVTRMHGFLNVAILAALIYHQKITPDEGLAVLKESSIQSFRFTDDEIGWNDYSLSLSEIQVARQRCFRSFGSCSFQDPISDLQKLDLIS
jgi:hypothetical protein